MTRYYLHLRNGTDELVDPDGREYPSLAASAKPSFWVREISWQPDARNGSLDFRYRIDAEDKKGTIVYTMRLEDAVDIITDDSVLPPLGAS